MFVVVVHVFYKITCTKEAVDWSIHVFGSEVTLKLQGLRRLGLCG